MHEFWADALLILSLLAFLAGVVIEFWRYSYKSRLRSHRHILFIMCLFSAVVFLVSSALVAMSGQDKANFATDFVYVMSYVFQLFTVNAAFTDAVQYAQIFFSGGFQTLFDVLAVFYTVLVPLAGGFVIFNLLSGVAPKFALMINSFKRAKYVFSELNERSVTLAEDIAYRAYKARSSKADSGSQEDKWLKSCVIVFTGVSQDTDQKLLERAKRVGAICMTDSVLERNLYFCRGKDNKRVIYFMINTDPAASLDGAVTLLFTGRGVWKRTVTPYKTVDTRVRRRRTDNMSMYVFTENEMAHEILEDAFAFNCERIAVKDKEKAFVAPCDENISVKIINEYKNLVYKLLDDRDNGGYPLYYHLARDGKKGRAEAVKIAVVGGGKISCEFFKAAVWCGQMLSADKSATEDGFGTIPIDVTFLSQNASELEESLKFACPKLFLKENLDLFHLTVSFEDVSFGEESFEKAFDKHDLVHADYVLVALGDDDLNLRAAGFIKRKMALRGDDLTSSIHYAIENGALLKTLQRRCDRLVADEKDIIVHPFGSLEERYNLNNVELSSLEARAESTDRVYDGARSAKRFMRTYEFESSMAAALHFSYKKYCMDGFAGDKDFDARMYWLEHLRWMAFMYAQGFRCPSAKAFLKRGFPKANEGVFKFDRDSRKDNRLRIHCCLVKSGKSLNYIVQTLKIYGECVAKSGDGRSDGLSACLANENAGYNELVSALRQTETYQRLTEKIKARLASNEDKSLDEFLNDCFGDVLNSADKGVDGLDKLNLFIALFNYGKIADLKQYDVDIAKNSLRYRAQLDLLAAFERKQDLQNLGAERKKNVDMLFGNCKIDALEKIPCGEVGGYKITASKIAFAPAYDLVALRVDPALELTGGKAIKAGEGVYLVAVPLKGFAKIGAFYQGDKKLCDAKLRYQRQDVDIVELNDKQRLSAAEPYDYQADLILE